MTQITQGTPLTGTQLTGLALASLLKNPRYNFQQIGCLGNPNARLGYIGYVDDATIHIHCFPSRFGGPAWISITVGFGEVRNVWESKAPVAEHGVLSATSHYTHPGVPDVGGQALSGYEIQGLKWRVGGIAPKSRTSIGLDGYIQSDDIIATLLAMREVVSGKASPQDPSFCEWDTAALGFGDDEESL